MNKEKEIKEMTEVVMCAMEYREKTGTPHFELIAQNLIEAGYGNVKKDIKEFAGNIIELLSEMIMEHSSEYNDGYDDAVADCITNIKSRQKIEECKKQ